MEAPNSKTWWTKRVLSNDYHCAGRLSERQLKYAAESGFATILSLFTYSDRNLDDVETPGDRYDPDLPTTKQSKQIVSGFDDVMFRVILGRDDDWKTESTVIKVRDLVHTSPKPILLYCENSYASIFLLLACHALTSHPKSNENEEQPHISDKHVFKIGAQLGYNYGDDLILVELISKLTGQPLIQKTPSPQVCVHDWYDIYWAMKPVYKRWFICGQFQSDQIKHMAQVGFKTLVNVRTGKPALNEKQFQEEVTLLNVNGSVDTRGNRQGMSNLLASRINKSQPKSYITETSQFNYEFVNPLEFGDGVGYNDTTEKRHLGKFMCSAEYVHIPIDNKLGCTSADWRRYREAMQYKTDPRPVLIHCSTSDRAAQLALLAAAYTHRLSSAWVVERGRIMGYDLTKAGYMELLEDQLDNRTFPEELD